MMEWKYSLEWLQGRVGQNQPTKFLYFWGHTPKKGQEIGKFCFSQWFPSEFEVNGISYQTAEHWMMAHKALLFDDQDAFDQVIASANPKEAKAWGRKVRNFDSDEWSSKSYDIVVKGNIHKFSQNQQMGSFLLGTDAVVLVEASPQDAIWGIGLPEGNAKVHDVNSWRGLNLLGFALMDARDFIKEHGFLSTEEINKILK